jgi:apolipoprotein N-acyltransferase
MRLLRKILPSWQSLPLAVLAAVLLVLAFPDFEFWFLAWFALVPLMWAVEREKESVAKAFVVGWFFGTLFFFGTCWWLTYAPIHYAGFPWPLAYFLILIACLGAGVFPGVFAAILSKLLRRFGSGAFLAAPFVWVFSEFLRYWLTGNNWNAIGYSQAFEVGSRFFGGLGGVLLVSFVVCLFSSVILLLIRRYWRESFAAAVTLSFTISLAAGHNILVNFAWDPRPATARLIAIQPNVPMSGVDYTKLGELRKRQFDLAEAEIQKLRSTNNDLPTTIILPESPMNFMYNDDPEFQRFVRDFTTRNNVSLIFNSAEPDPTNSKFFNSAMMIGPDGRPVAQYDKIYLLPFGEAVPVPLESIVPAFVGNFSYGREYDLLPLGDAKGGIMICFESHFGQLSREYVRNGADVLIEMTNDGYLGPTPVLRQHLANAVFRAVETNRPVLRVTNVGITAYITEKGAVLDPAPVYQEDTLVWTVSKSDGSQTFYVRYGDWFAWLCSVVTIGLLMFGALRSPTATNIKA